MDDAAQLWIFFHQSNVPPIVALSSLTDDAGLHFGATCIMHSTNRFSGFANCASL